MQLSAVDSIKNATVVGFWINKEYTLLNSSWCGPCRVENVVKCYDQYHNKGLEIMGVSIDESKDRAKWLKAVRDDKLPWVQLSDLKGWENEVARMYGHTGCASKLSDQSRRQNNCQKSQG
jgi:alkyl hydroperoxide reductase subunit AhpC